MKPVHFITYGDFFYHSARERIAKEAKRLGIFTSIQIVNPDLLSPDFRHEFQDVLKSTKGGGYWIWKPHIILQKLHQINDDEFLIYCDAGCTVNSNGKKRLEEYLDLVFNHPSGILSFQMDYPESSFTTNQTFLALDRIIRETDKDKTDNTDFNSKDLYGNSGQYVAGILIMRKCPNVLKIFNRFFDLIRTDHALITDFYNDTNSCLIHHRHDQSILSLLRKHYGSIVLPDETYNENFKDIRTKYVPFLATRRFDTTEQRMKHKIQDAKRRTRK